VGLRGVPRNPLISECAAGLKILRKVTHGLGYRELADFHQRFQLEVQLGTKLDHPDLIRVYDFEQDNKNYRGFYWSRRR
jgi:hypothetical protein